MRWVPVVVQTEGWGHWAWGITWRVEGDVRKVEYIAVHDAVGGETRCGCGVHSVISLLEKKEENFDSPILSE